MKEQSSISLVSEAKRRYRRAWWTGIALSAVLHVVLFAWAAREFRLNAARFDALPQAVRPPDGIQVIEVRPIAPEEAEAREERRLVQLPPDPEERARTPDRNPVVDGVPTPVSGGRDEDGLGMTNAEKLQPREGDRRLWKDFEQEQMPDYIQNRWARAETCTSLSASAPRRPCAKSTWTPGPCRSAKSSRRTMSAVRSIR
jgi:hypothetical protein